MSRETELQIEIAETDGFGISNVPSITESKTWVDAKIGKSLANSLDNSIKIPELVLSNMDANREVPTSTDSADVDGSKFNPESATLMSPQTPVYPRQ